MKKITILILLILTRSLYGQQQTLTFTDGTEKTGLYEVKYSYLSDKPYIKSIETKEKYSIEEISSLKFPAQGRYNYYKTIEILHSSNDKNPKKTLGLLVYSSEKIELFRVSVANHSIKVSPYDIFYARKKNDSFAYNISYTYGIDALSLKRRLKEYFADCPDLSLKIDKNEIDKNNTFKIVQYYDANCGK